MVVKIGHKVPDFEAPVCAKMELWELEYGGAFKLACWILVIYYVKRGLFQQKLAPLYINVEYLIWKLLKNHLDHSSLNFVLG